MNCSVLTGSYRRRCADHGCGCVICAAHDCADHGCGCGCGFSAEHDAGYLQSAACTATAHTYRCFGTAQGHTQQQRRPDGLGANWAASVRQQRHASQGHSHSCMAARTRATSSVAPVARAATAATFPTPRASALAVSARAATSVRPGTCFCRGQRQRLGRLALGCGFGLSRGRPIVPPLLRHLAAVRYRHLLERLAILAAELFDFPQHLTEGRQLRCCGQISSHRTAPHRTAALRSERRGLRPYGWVGHLHAAHHLAKDLVLTVQVRLWPKSASVSNGRSPHLGAPRSGCNTHT